MTGLQQTTGVGNNGDVNEHIWSNYMKKKPGLYANIQKRRKSGKPMRKKGEKGAPTDKAFRDSAKTAKKRKK